MAEFNWEQLLQQWNECVFASPTAQALPQEVMATKWLGSPPASETQLAAAEKRLGISLPPSFRRFLAVSNGWRYARHEISKIWGTEELAWFRKSNRDWVAAYTQPSLYGSEPEVPDEEYFSYSQWVEHFRRSHLKETLQISEIGDAAVLLLNPQVISSDGEWEAWFFANWLPGAHRYRSFEELMQAQYYHMAGLEWKQPTGVQGPLPDEYIGSPGSAKRKLKKRKKPRQQKVLGKPVKEWTVKELLAMLQREDYNLIHGEVIDGLAKLGDPEAIAPLLDMVRPDHPLVAAAIHALKALAPERLPDPLREVLRARSFWGFHAAAMALAEFKDLRAVPLLVEAMKDLCPESMHLSECIGQHVAAFGSAGFEALVALLKSDQPVVRRRAVNGLLCTNKADAADVIRPLLGDPDPDVRQMVEIALSVLPPKLKTKPTPPNAERR